MEHKNPPTELSQMPSLSGVTVLQVIPALETGGAERTTLEVGCALVQAGARSLVVSEGGPMVVQLEQEGSRHIELPAASKNPLTLWRNRGRLLSLIRGEGVDIVHARSRAPAWSALWAARRAGVRFVTTYHGIYRAKTAPKRFYNSAMARGDRVIANSQFTADAVSQTYSGQKFFDAGRMVTIPRGADLSRFDPDALSEDRRASARQAFGGEGAFRVLLPGRLTSWKGQMVLIEAARLLQAENLGTAMRVVMIGSAQGRDEYAAGLAAAMKEAGLTDVIHIHGHWDDMPAAYDWADVTLSTSTRPEAFGRVAIEAQAMGCPVIASAHGGALETVKDGQTGWL
ncbi:MAG: glycosyltransferase family 4 protein, partial [Pseudomonadota bacterium]